MKLKNCFLSFIDQHSLIKLKSYSFLQDSRNVELVIKPIAGFKGDKILGGMRNVFVTKKVILPMPQTETIKEIEDDKLYPVFGYGLFGSSNGNILLNQLTSINPYHSRIVLLDERIRQMETVVNSMRRTIGFLSSPVQEQISTFAAMLKEIKRLSEPSGIEAFTYQYPQFAQKQEGESE